MITEIETKVVYVSPNLTLYYDTEKRYFKCEWDKPSVGRPYTVTEITEDEFNNLKNL